MDAGGTYPIHSRVQQIIMILFFERITFASVQKQFAKKDERTDEDNAEKNNLRRQQIYSVHY